MTNINTSPPKSQSSQITAAKYNTITKEKAGSREVEHQADAESIPSIKISGRALMLSRLFNQNNENTEIPVETNTTDSAITGSKSIVHWLTNEDRTTLEKAYEYANANGIDLRYVDDLASDMAMYRYTKSVTRGDIYDLEGHKVTFDFTDADRNIADRIKNSATANETRIDRGFLEWVLDSSKPNHAVKFEFLELMVHELPANEAKSNNYSGEDFKSYIGGPNEIVTRVSTEVNTYYTSFKPDYVSINGVGRWLTDSKDGGTEKEQNTTINNLLKQQETQAMTLLQYLISENQNNKHTKT